MQLKVYFVGVQKVLVLDKIIVKLCIVKFIN